MISLFQKNISVILLIAGVLISASIFAQDKRPPGPPPPLDSTHIVKMAQDLATELELSEEQEEQVTKLYLNHFKEMGSRKSEDRPDPKEMDVSREKLEENIKQILTDKQKEKYEVFLEDRKKHFKHAHQPGPPPGE